VIGYKFCPGCRNDLTLVDHEAGNPQVHCEHCGFRKWNNPLPTTIGLIVEHRNVLLLKRTHAPRRGQWDRAAAKSGLCWRVWVFVLVCWGGWGVG